MAEIRKCEVEFLNCNKCCRRKKFSFPTFLYLKTHNLCRHMERRFFTTDIEVCHTITFLGVNVCLIEKKWSVKLMVVISAFTQDSRTFLDKQIESKVFLGYKAKIYQHFNNTYLNLHTYCIYIDNGISCGCFVGCLDFFSFQRYTITFCRYITKNKFYGSHKKLKTGFYVKRLMRKRVITH